MDSKLSLWWRESSLLEFWQSVVCVTPLSRAKFRCSLSWKVHSGVIEHLSVLGSSPGQEKTWHLFTQTQLWSCTFLHIIAAFPWLHPFACMGKTWRESKRAWSLLGVQLVKGPWIFITLNLNNSWWGRPNACTAYRTMQKTFPFVIIILLLTNMMIF